MQATHSGTAAEAMPCPQVSIVIPNHNYARFLRGCFGSVLAQRVNPRRLEVIFVDDASSDGSLELAREILSAMPFGRHEVIALPRQRRPGPVRNAGLSRARGQALLTLDPDDELLPDFLPRSLAALAAGADVVYTDYLVEEGGGSRRMCLGGYSKLQMANQNILSPTALFSRRLWDQGARFRSETTYEDWDFWIQLALLGGKFAHVAEPLYRYRLHGGNYSFAARQFDASSKARIVLDNRDFFPSWTLAWAKNVQQGEPGVDSFGRGLIPILQEHAARRLPM